jgi:polysaccharide deacetylase 2 family uncharacterized protein YibQ
MFWGCEIKRLYLKPAASPELRACRYRNTLGTTLRDAALLLGLLLLSHSALALDTPLQECSKDTPVNDPQDKRLVIIIDDMGHSLRRGNDALALPGKLNFAVIPYTPFGEQLAETAHRSGKEVMLHAPMSTVEQLPLGTGGLTPELSREEFQDTISAALATVPHVRGINNHMGSDLTQRREQMAWLMQDLRWQDLYFVDSRTSEKSVAATVATEFDVPNLSRHVFLDNERTPEAIDARFTELLAVVNKHGLAVAIGHPYPQTISYLHEALPLLSEQGIRLVFVSEALAREPIMNLASIDTDLLEDAKPGC